MITFQCSRCKETCQANPLHTGRLHTCEHCGLILTVPGKPARKRTQVRKLGFIEVLIGGGAVVSIVALGLVVSTMSNRSAQAARTVYSETPEPTPAPVTAVTQTAKPADSQQARATKAPNAPAPAPAPAPAQLEPVVIVIE